MNKLMGVGRLMYIRLHLDELYPQADLVLREMLDHIAALEERIHDQNNDLLARDLIIGSLRMQLAQHEQAVQGSITSTRLSQR